MASLTDLRDVEYVTRRDVMTLRRLVYEAPDPSAVPDDLRERLRDREQELHEAERERAELQGREAKNGLIIDTASSELFLGPETTKLEARLTLRMSHVPTAVVHLLKAGSDDEEGDPLVTCEVRNMSDDIRRLRVSSFVDGYASSTVDTVEIKGKGKHTFHQLPTFRPESLHGLTDMTRATLNVLAEDLDSQKVELHRTHPIWLLPPTSAPLFILDPSTGRWRDMTPWFGAFVTPNAPEVIRFLRTAADRHPERVLGGYQGDEAAVEPQVKAVFEALKAAGITYVNSVLTSSPDEGFADQRVRLPREALGDRQANCIDGTVLYASLLEGMSMNPGIVVVPGHAFLAWETWRDSGKWSFLETTMTGSHSFEQARATGERTATTFAVTSDTRGPEVRLWGLRQLRSELGITPMS